MIDSAVPAPLWRRLAASIYDGLLLLGLWMATLLLSLPIQKALGISAGSPWLRAVLFFVGGAFFCWFWIRGGQTLGMRAWRLQVQRSDGAALRLPIAAIRYAAMMLYWSLVLTPVAVGILARFPKVAADFPHALGIAIAATTLVAMSLAIRGLDLLARLPHDRISGTMVLALATNPLPPVKRRR